MRPLKDFILEAIHEGPMHLDEIIRVLHSEYNLTWLAVKDHPEIGKFLPYSKVDDLDASKTMSDNRCGIWIYAAKTPGKYGLGLLYVSTEKSQYGDGTRRRELDWMNMSNDTLQNITICLRKVLSQFEEKMEKEYTKHPKAKDLENEICNFVERQVPRGFDTRNVEVGIGTRELTKDDKKSGFSCIIDMEINPHNPQQRLSIGIDKNDCLKYVWQTTYGECKKGLATPNQLILWKDVESQIATMLQSY